MPEPHDIQSDFKAVERLVNGAAAQVDKTDQHFFGNSPAGRSLEDDEVQLLMSRRKAVVVLHHIRDSAATVLSMIGPEPTPFKDPAPPEPEGGSGSMALLVGWQV